MALRQRKAPSAPTRTIYDFLPVYAYREPSGWRWYFNGPVALALLVGIILGHRFLP